MKVELHCHTNRYSGCARSTPAELMERMIELGYSAVYITEHDAVWADWEIEQLQAGFPGIRIFPGLEKSIIDEEHVKHILVLGTTDPAYLALDDETAVLAKARAEGHLSVLAHPFRWPGGGYMLAAGHLPDALEHRTGNHDATRAKIAADSAEQYNLRMVNSGDTHGVEMLGRFWIETFEPIEKPDDIRGIVAAGAYRNCAAEEEEKA